MTRITNELITELRSKTGVGMMDCKKALTESNGDIEKAIELLRKKGAKVAEKRAGLDTNNGLIHAYIHPGSTIGVLIEIGTETDFSANTEDIKQFAHNVCMQIAATNPQAIDIHGINPALLAKEREIASELLRGSNKPEKIVEKIVEGKIAKLCESLCLLNQQYIKNDTITINDYLNEIRAKIGENIKINRFARFQIGS